MLRLYTDGSCAFPGAVGGWAWVLVNEEEAVGFDSGTTPGATTHMASEVTAAIEGRLPHGMGVARLCDLPAEWSRQHQMLALPAL